VLREIGGEVDPVIDLLARHDERVSGLDRIDRQERHRALVLPDEARRQLAADDLREDARHHPSRELAF
jgi:hypothetical protein